MPNPPAIFSGDFEQVYKCFARTSSMQLKERYLVIKRQTLLWLHKRKSNASGTMAVSMRVDLSQAHIVKKTSIKMKKCFKRSVSLKMAQLGGQ